jgi:WXXGXW repeat (2 copies)
VMKRRLIFGSLVLSAAALAMTGCAVGAWVPIGPPDALVEVHGGFPGPGYVWIDGYWQWQNRWVWRPGAWARPPRAGARWEAPRWEHGRRGWRFHEGRWRSR